MKPLTALASVLTDAAFHAEVSGEVIESNSPFAQLMRCMVGDDWRLHVEVGDRALVDAFWGTVFSEPDEVHQPVSFHLIGGEDRYQLTAQAVSTGEVQTAVGIITVEQKRTTQRWNTDAVTGLPETDAAIERFDELLSRGRTFAGAVVLLDDGSEDDVIRKEAARQLLSTIRPTDLLSIASDGRFVVCAAGIENSNAATAMASRMLTALNESEITARVGLVLSDFELAAATLLREAEAGAHASEHGTSGFAPEWP